ncbi:hypothetical protein LUZ61_015529 [Rhynchospora tenuis]|uniref:BTB domain-containing protein n=1 Tax=Rhynchospora tenuis TaxID=198213 RepID=A0AAD5Z3T2_9POAL|nr:hypothetical protein LUZ61_015529 [Rhynchospora tenuis]
MGGDLYKMLVAYNAQQQLRANFGNLLKSGKMADVTIEVNGELFQAHRAMLAARSPAFRAELFGLIVESKPRHIKIEDIETAVFKYLLEYIYTDTFDGKLEIPSTNLALQLLVVGDRYRMEGLKLKCEEKLSKSVSLDSVLSYFALAEQHNCSKLRESCFKFVNIFTKEYLQFMQNHPNLVAELHKRIIFFGAEEEVAQD